MKYFSRFIKPGFTRIQIKDDNQDNFCDPYIDYSTYHDYLVSAYKKVEDNELKCAVIVAINLGYEDKELCFNLDNTGNDPRIMEFMAFQSYQDYNDNYKPKYFQQDPIPIEPDENGFFAYNIPKLSITTFYWNIDLIPPGE